MPYIVKSAWCHGLVIHLVGTGDFDLVILVLVGQINFATILDLSLLTSGCTAGPLWSNTSARSGYAMISTMTSTFIVN